MTISLPPDIHRQLGEYLEQYRAAYRAAYRDESAGIADLIPAMLETFLRADKGFQRKRSQANSARERP